jgi:hypothetical protein
MTEDVETRDERRARQAIEGRAAMADYRRQQDEEIEKARRLVAERGELRRHEAWVGPTLPFPPAATSKALGPRSFGGFL